MEKRFQLVVDINQEREYYIQDTQFGGTVYFHFGGLEKKAAEQLVDLINTTIEMPDSALRGAIHNERAVKEWVEMAKGSFGIQTPKGMKDWFETTYKRLDKIQEQHRAAIKELTDIRTFVNADPNESTYDEVVRMKSLMEKEVIDDMERMRRNLWAETAVRVAGSSNTIKDETPTKYADRVLDDFDKRFNNKTA